MHSTFFEILKNYLPKILDNNPPLAPNPRPPLSPEIKEPIPPPIPDRVFEEPPKREPKPPPKPDDDEPGVLFLPENILARISGPATASKPFPTFFQSIPAFLNFSPNPNDSRNPGFVASSGVVFEVAALSTN